MFTFIFKIAFLIAVGGACFCLLTALLQRRDHLEAWIRGGQKNIAERLDLAGLRAGGWVISLLACIGPVAHVILRLVRRRRMMRADAQLADATALLGNALKAGLSFAQAFSLAAAEVPPPLGEELARAAGEQRLGRTIEESLATLEARLPTEDVGLFVQSVEVLRRTGGNLIETFAQLSATIEERRRVAEKIRTLTAQGVAQAIVLLLLPWGLAAALHLLAPEFIAPLFTTRLGLALLAAVVALEVAGALWLRKIVVVRV